MDDGQGQSAAQLANHNSVGDSSQDAGPQQQQGLRAARCAGPQLPHGRESVCSPGHGSRHEQAEHHVRWEAAGSAQPLIAGGCRDPASPCGLALATRHCLRVCCARCLIPRALTCCRNLLLLGAIGAPALGLAGPFAIFFVPPRFARGAPVGMQRAGLVHRAACRHATPPPAPELSEPSSHAACHPCPHLPAALAAAAAARLPRTPWATTSSSRLGLRRTPQATTRWCRASRCGGGWGAAEPPWHLHCSAVWHLWLLRSEAGASAIGSCLSQQQQWRRGSGGSCGARRGWPRLAAADERWN